MCLPPVPEANQVCLLLGCSWEGGVWSLNPRDKSDSKASVPVPCTLTHSPGLCEQLTHSSQSPITVA